MSLTSFIPTSIVSAVRPLLTTFTPPGYCTSAIGPFCYSTTYSGWSEHDCGFIGRDMTCGPEGSPTFASVCFPDEADPFSILLYSPAIACPVGWTTAGWVETTSDHRTATCCPFGYTVGPVFTTSCQKSISNLENETTMLFCSSDGSLVRSTLTRKFFYEYYNSVWAHQILIALPTSSSESSSTTKSGSSTSSSTSLNISVSVAVSTGTNSDGEKRKSKSRTGRIAGIIVGAIAAFILIGALIMLWRRKQRHAKHFARYGSSREQEALPEFVGGNGTDTEPTQMTAISSDRLFQPRLPPTSTR